MLTIEIRSLPDSEGDVGSHRLVVNGVEDPNSWAGTFGEKYGRLNDPNLVTIVLTSFVSEVMAQGIGELYLPYDANWCEYVYRVELLSPAKDSTRPRLKFEFSLEIEEWDRPWSIAKLASTVDDVVKKLAIAGLSSYRDDEDFVTNGFGVICEITETNVSVGNTIERWEPTLAHVMKRVSEELLRGSRQGALTEIFDFPEEVSVACQQYLIYFGQFLADVGIEASVQVDQQADHVFFSVTPKDKHDALEVIRSMLDSYLRIPGDPHFGSDSSRATDVAVFQLRANVAHLEAQMNLAQAVLQTKNATIQAMELSNFRLHQLVNAAQGTSHPALVGDKESPKKKDSEAIIEGVLSVRDSEVKGIVFHLPEIIRRLKRKIRR
jgi:hypothetical protein